MFEFAVAPVGPTTGRVGTACAGLVCTALMATAVVLGAPANVAGIGWAVLLAAPPGPDTVWHGPIQAPPNKHEFLAGVARRRVAPVSNCGSGPDRPRRISLPRMPEPLYRVDPEYPALARQARISGTVELMGVVGTDGHVCELKVIKGHPLLVYVAIEAVRHWVYDPVLLDGEPVEVEGRIYVKFILSR